MYGGHTIGLALHQAVRALPDLLTVVGWHGCDHLAPVREGDTLTSTVTVERTEPLRRRRPGPPALPGPGPAATAREPTEVLDWRFVAGSPDLARGGKPVAAVTGA